MNDEGFKSIDPAGNWASELNRSNYLNQNLS